MNNSLTLVPEGGLANRMKAIASAYELCRMSGYRLQIVWFKDKGLNAPFEALFEPLPTGRFAGLREARFTDYILNDRPKRKNLYLTRLLQRLFYHRSYYAPEMMALIKSGFDFKQLLRGAILFNLLHGFWDVQSHCL